MPQDWVLLEKEQGVATLVLNRPDKRNAMHQALIEQFVQLLNTVAADESIHVVVLKGAGEHFCAGGDIYAMQAMAMAPYQQNVADAHSLATLIYQLYHLPQPTVALAHGAIMGGGLGLLSACDMVLATQSAVFGFSEVKIGIVPSIISPYVIDAIGVRAARYYFMTGERFSAADALRLGLVHQVVSDHSLLTAANDLVKQLLQNSSSAMQAAKSWIRYVHAQPISDELVRKSAEHLATLRASKEGLEGLSAFIEKRDPKWR